MLILSWDVVWGYKATHKKRKKNTKLNAQRGQWCITWMAPFMSPTYHKHNAEGSGATPWNAFRKIWHSAFLGFVVWIWLQCYRKHSCTWTPGNGGRFISGYFPRLPFLTCSAQQETASIRHVLTTVCHRTFTFNHRAVWRNVWGCRSPIYFITKLFFFVPNCRSRMLLIIHY